MTERARREDDKATSPTSKHVEKEVKGPWLSAYHNPVADVKAYSNCIDLVDVYGDGDYKLIVADADKRLKMYKGTTLYNEQALLGRPSSLTHFYPDSNHPRVPCIAVGAGAYIYIYRHFRPHYKFTVPALETEAEEVKVWESLFKCTIDIPAAMHQLAAIRQLGIRLSDRSKGLMAIDDIDEQAEYVTQYLDEPLVEPSSINCMTYLRKAHDVPNATSCLVVATETHYVYILNPQGNTAKIKIKIPGIPVDIAAAGVLDVESRIIVSTRHGAVYTIKNNELQRSIIVLEAPPCGLVLNDKSMIIACADRKLVSYHVKGKKNWSLTLPDDILAIESFDLERTKDTHGVLVGLKNGNVALYNEKIKVSTLAMDGILTGIRFGRYGREEASLVLVQKTGALSIKILRRVANLEAISDASGPPPEQDIPLDIPKKTKLYVEQTQRERDHAIEMHRHFQRDLCKLRLTTARAYVKIIKDGQAPLSYTTGTALRLNAQVQGLGPSFRINLHLQNAGSRSVQDLIVAFHYDHSLYRMTKSVLQVPLVIPNAQYAYKTEVESVLETGAADNIYIFVCGQDSCVPLVSAVVSMPLSEVDL